VPNETVPRWAQEVGESFAAALGERWAHARSVTEAVRALSTNASLDLLSAALLHDIGYAPRLRRTGMHAIDGAAHLREIGVPDQVISLVAFHTGAEYEADERGLSHELARFDRPRQDFLDALTLADLTTGPAGQPVSVAERLDDIFDRYGPDDVVHRAVLRSRAYLEACVDRAMRLTAGQPT
jgi:putative nucleotidyltransferase with HDIG domain